MKITKYIFLFSAILFIASSCTTTKKAVPYAPLTAQINLTMDNLEYIGAVSGTATQSYVLSIPWGGRKYKTGVLTSQTGFDLPGLGMNRALNNALYDALMSKPDADFVLPISVESTTEQMFLGKKVTLKISAKAFKIKTK